MDQYVGFAAPLCLFVILSFVCGLRVGWSSGCSRSRRIFVVAFARATSKVQVPSPYEIALHFREEVRHCTVTANFAEVDREYKELIEKGNT